jgi:hypothetical protein
MEFLRYVISSGRLTMDKKKVVAVQEWKVPTKVKDVQSFLGFANFYRQFIQGFSVVAEPLFTLMRKDSFSLRLL